ncbi:MAG: GNAT family N-acetyltransferase [Ferruginibacter sp.]
MISTYSCLQKQQFQSSEFSLVPLREEDKYDIMRWRNEQIYHLRQVKPLTKEDQDNYFKNVVSKIYGQEQPSQILFSYLKEDVCIGYGGLVHINWVDKNAEISFIIDTKLEKDHLEFHWINYLGLIEQVAYTELNLHKLFTYAFAGVRPQLSIVLEKAGYREDARLTEHCLFSGKFIDVVIHSKMNTVLTYRRAAKDDMLLYFDWAKDEEVRRQSYQSASIQLEDHEKWFLKKIVDRHCVMLVFENDQNQPVGQVRFQKNDEENFAIGASIAKDYRGKGLATTMYIAATDYFFKVFPSFDIVAYVKAENTVSIRAIEKAGYSFVKKIDMEGTPSVVYTKTKPHENS